MKKNSVLVSLLFSVSLLVAGCSNPESSSAAAGESSKVEPINPIVDFNQKDPENPIDDEIAQALPPQILLFNGVGISPSDWQTTEMIIRSTGLTYKLVNSAALNAMPLEQLKTFKLILIPGGNSNYINNGLTKAAKIRVRQAVRDWGVSYLGFCAGAYAAVGTDTASNTTAYYGFAVAKGAFLTRWYPADKSLYASVPLITFSNGTRRSMIWWDGPFTSEWSGGVVARYPDGKPAISQTRTGKGLVIVSGPHPEAPSSWQWDAGTDPDGLDHDIAAYMIRSGVNKTLLPVTTTW